MLFIVVNFNFVLDFGTHLCMQNHIVLCNIDFVGDMGKGTDPSKFETMLQCFQSFSRCYIPLNYYKTILILFFLSLN